MDGGHGRRPWTAADGRAGWRGFVKLKRDILHQIRAIQETHKTPRWQRDVGHATIFHALLSSGALPAEEKSPARLAQEGQILVQGGTLTSAWALTIAVFHLVRQPATLRRLRDELFAAMPDGGAAVPLATLEHLPYLGAVVREALRHSIGTSGRLPRVAPREALVARDRASGRAWVLPAGTVASMSPYLVAMGEEHFAACRDFCPERWLEPGRARERHHMQLFGGGTRVCLGLNLAHAELLLATAGLFRRWGGGAAVGAAAGAPDGDRRPGDVGVLRMCGSTPRDCEMAADYFIPRPFKVRRRAALGLGALADAGAQGSKGVRLVLEACR